MGTAKTFVKRQRLIIPIFFCKSVKINADSTPLEMGISMSIIRSESKFSCTVFPWTSKNTSKQSTVFHPDEIWKPMVVDLDKSLSTEKHVAIRNAADNHFPSKLLQPTMFALKRTSSYSLINAVLLPYGLPKVFFSSPVVSTHPNNPNISLFSACALHKPGNQIEIQPTNILRT